MTRSGSCLRLLSWLGCWQWSSQLLQSPTSGVFKSSILAPCGTHRCRVLVDSFRIDRRLCSTAPTDIVPQPTSQALDDELDLTPSAVSTIVGFMNRENGEDLKRYVEAYTALGTEAAKKNAWTQGSFVLEAASLEALDGEGLTIKAKIRERSFWGKLTYRDEVVRVQFPVERPLTTAEGVKRVLMELSRRQGLVETTARIYKIPVGSFAGLPPNLHWNNVPHSRQARDFVYRGATTALLRAVLDKKFSRTMQVKCLVPETNPQMDTMRVGTVLELVRDMATSLAGQGLRVKVCIQGSMGEGIFTGLPLALSGMRTIMERMDWGQDGYLGDKINFGQVGAKFFDPEDDVVIIISPQSIVGSGIYGPLREMHEAVTSANKAFVVFNPQLADKPSAQGVMSMRGRGDRIKFAQSFQDAYLFRLLYPSSASYFPIVGAIMKSGPYEPYVVFRRDDLAGGEEEYVPLGTFDEEPSSADITKLFVYS